MNMECDVIKLNMKRVLFEKGTLMEKLPNGSLADVTHLVLVGDMVASDIAWLNGILENEASGLERLDMGDTTLLENGSWDELEFEPELFFCETDMSELPMLRSVTFPKWVEFGYDVIYACESLVSAYVIEENEWMTEVDGVIYDKGITTLLCCPKERRKNLVVPEGVTSIGEEAIDKLVFVEEIHLPKSLKEFDWKIFMHCNSLKRIVFDNKKSDIVDDILKESMASYMEIVYLGDR